MFAILTLIFVIAVSMLITKIATIALTHTGMSRDRAQFQARSAFSGAGFTTSESEVVVKHPVRRRIIMTLILLGNAGVVTAVSSLILGFVGDGGSSTYIQNLSLLFLGVLLLFLLAKSQRLDRLLDSIINALLNRYSRIKPRTFDRLMTVMEDYEVTELDVANCDWLKGSCLKDLKLIDEGVLVLGIIRKDLYIGVPRGRYEILEDDRLVLYGKADRIARISKRQDARKGKQEHQQSVKEQETVLKKQDAEVESTSDESSAS